MHYNFIKQTNKPYLEELNNRWHEFPNVWKAVNLIQKTEWVVNEPVYDVVKSVFENNYGLGNIPKSKEHYEFPIKPIDFLTNEEAKIKWKREASKVHRLIAKSKAKWIQVKMILEQAEYFIKMGRVIGQDSFWYPQQLDFRGRVYPKPVMLSPQSADYARSLIKFKFGKPMGSNEAFDNFAVYGAGLFGTTDKEELSVRRQWVLDNAEQIISTANNPLEDTFWCKADKPYTFLAWCIEYRDFANTDFSPEFITTLPIQQDCSNSGLQHYSAMMKDEIGGKACNLVPSNKPHDVYGIVANKLTMKLRNIVKDGMLENKKKCDTEEKRQNNISMAQNWLDYGIDRKICKKPVMCLPYSLTQYSCRNYVQEHVEKEFLEKNRQHNFGNDLFHATIWITPILWSSINDIIVGAKEIMKFLKDVSKLVAKENLPVSWTTPLGLPVTMFTYKKKSIRVKTQMGDTILKPVKLSVSEYTDKIDPKKTSQSCCPNFIHSIDASLLMLAVVKASEYGIDNFSLIHDSYGVLAPDVDIMSKALREAFVEIYSDDVLANWAMEMKQMLSDKNKAKFPNIPAKGNLNINDVKKSVFFCV
jgi:DNA-directed RNA polymerase